MSSPAFLLDDPDFEFTYPIYVPVCPQNPVIFQVEDTQGWLLFTDRDAARTWRERWDSDTPVNFKVCRSEGALLNFLIGPRFRHPETRKDLVVVDLLTWDAPSVRAFHWRALVHKLTAPK